MPDLTRVRRLAGKFLTSSIGLIFIGKRTGSTQARSVLDAAPPHLIPLLGFAKLNGLDPAAWLKDALEKLPTCRNSDIDALLPFRNAKSV